jgi:hypothetical protein
MGRKPKPPAEPSPNQVLLAELQASGVPLLDRVPALGDGPTDRTEITAAGLQALEAATAEGINVVTAAKLLGCSKSTLQGLAKRDERVAEAMARGKAQLADTLTSIFLKQAREGNVVSAIFLAKCAAGFRETDAVEQRPNIIIHLPDALSPEAYMKTLEANPVPAIPHHQLKDDT